VTGIEGNFRQTCNNVMRVLRENKDSVMAVLEAFVYDPLLNWRLIDGNNLVIVFFIIILLMVSIIFEQFLVLNFWGIRYMY
jgi:phosphatidylinositol kinase/protein kinase (PI-3  family)